MGGEFEKPITIREAIRQIEDNNYLLPAIQRNFIWKAEQISNLFDSLMRGFPINTFMLWDVQDQSIKRDYKFYRVLNKYVQRFRESGDHIPTQGNFKNFKAIIDGQQRLTSIYIGLKGTYAVKKPRVHWTLVEDHSLLPPKRLYINLSSELSDEDNEDAVKYNIKFLSDSATQTATQENYWFPIGEILDFSEVNTDDEILDMVIMPYLERNNLQNNQFARRTLNRLYHVIRKEKVINYYLEQAQDIDQVLAVFIRTNNGGTPLQYSDLLMSMAVRGWEGDARYMIDGLINEVRQSAGMNFTINRDWVLKTSLMLVEREIQFKVRNFDEATIRLIESNWSEISECIKNTFRLLTFLGFTDAALRSKNSVIPISYFLFKKAINGIKLYQEILKFHKYHEIRKDIAQWLTMVTLKGSFGGQSDSLLLNYRKVIYSNLISQSFPLIAIIDFFTAKSKDIRFDRAFVDSILSIQYQDSRCRSVLSLIFTAINPNATYQIDHLHPKAAFSKRNLDQQAFLQNDSILKEFFNDKYHWNSIVNLHLLEGSLNGSKLDKTLEQWYQDNLHGITRNSLLIPEETSISFSDFREFYDERKNLLVKKIIENLGIGFSQSEIEEEVIEEEIID